MSYGFVYILGNPAMPGIYKIGMTRRSPSLRCKELSATTSTPTPFELLAYYEFEDALGVEQGIHFELSDYRVSKNREFFRLGLFRIAEEARDWGPVSEYESYLVEVAREGPEPYDERPSTQSMKLVD